MTVHSSDQAYTADDVNKIDPTRDPLCRLFVDIVHSMRLTHDDVARKYLEIAQRLAKPGEDPIALGRQMLYNDKSMLNSIIRGHKRMTMARFTSMLQVLGVYIRTVQVDVQWTDKSGKLQSRMIGTNQMATDTDDGPVDLPNFISIPPTMGNTSDPS